jgi:hypothetical protein
MHPRIHEYLAEHHREELLREVGFAGSHHDHDHHFQATRTSRMMRNRRVLAYLLFGSHALAYRYIGQEWLLRRLQAHVNASMRLLALLVLAFGIFSGSLLDNRFGLLPALLFGCVLMLGAVMPVLARSIQLLKFHLARRTH